MSTIMMCRERKQWLGNVGTEALPSHALFKHEYRAGAVQCFYVVPDPALPTLLTIASSPLSVTHTP